MSCTWIWRIFERERDIICGLVMGLFIYLGHCDTNVQCGCFCPNAKLWVARDTNEIIYYGVLWL